MTDSVPNIRTASCHCGEVTIEVNGDPILGVICHCDDCQKAARQLEQLENAPPILDEYSGTAFHLCRKDRVSIRNASDLLVEHRLESKSPTSRMVATCCNTFMFLNFRKGHWLSILHDRFDRDAPKLQMRIQTKYSSGKFSLPNDTENCSSYPFKFVFRLLTSRLAMLFGR